MVRRRGHDDGGSVVLAAARSTAVTLLVVALVVVALASEHPTRVLAAARVSHARADTAVDTAVVEQYLRDGLDRLALPGLAAVVVEDGEVVLEEGFGSGGHGRPVDETTRFRVASLSKAFTAVTVLRLVERGLCELDAPAATYVRELAGATDERTARITVRHLLNQTSGISDGGLPSEAFADTGNLGSRVTAIGHVQLVSEPGREFHYSDANYQILARLAEEVGGLAFGDVVAREVFEPLGMRDTVATSTTVQDPEIPGLAQGHVLLFGQPVARDELHGLVTGSSGVITTARDMGHWLRWQLSGLTSDGRPLLDPALLRLSHTPPEGVETDYAMGWEAVPAGGGLPARLQHNGILSAWTADAVVAPGTGTAVALLYDGYNALVDTSGLRDGLLRLLSGGTAEPPRRTATVAAALGAMTAVLVALRVGALWRWRQWARRRRGRSMLWTSLRLAGPVVPATLLAMLPKVTLLAIGRRFSWVQLALAMPELVTLLLLAAVSGAAVSGLRLIALLRDA